MTKLPTKPSKHETPPKGVSRRGFLRAATLAAGAAVAGPTLWLPRRSRAATTALHGSAKHLLILHAEGGLRSSVLFNADLARIWNPHVDAMGNPTQPGAPGTTWQIGAIFDRDPSRRRASAKAPPSPPCRRSATP